MKLLVVLYRGLLYQKLLMSILSTNPCWCQHWPLRTYTRAFGSRLVKLFSHLRHWHGQQAGKVLAHCQAGIDRLRYATGGMQLAVYRIGITHDAYARFELYKQHGWSKMLVLFQTTELAQVEMLEAALISHHAHMKLCRNILKGGEGMRDKMFNAKFDGPYVCYCVLARADQGRWIT